LWSLFFICSSAPHLSTGFAFAPASFRVSVTAPSVTSFSSAIHTLTTTTVLRNAYLEDLSPENDDDDNDEEKTVEAVEVTAVESESVVVPSPDVDTAPSAFFIENDDDDEKEIVTTTTDTTTTTTGEATYWDGLKSAAKEKLRLFQASKKEGYSNKQAIADSVAGEYDKEAVTKKVMDMTKSAPCVMFVWKSSPSCKDAVAALDKTGASYTTIRLDDPWDEGNAMRASLGRVAGKASVPSIWIDGKYIGGYDAGVGDESPGLLDMAFKGTLRPALEKSGAL